MAAETETCYRHADRPTRVHCTRCGRPICPACMTPAPVGHHCPSCVAESRREGRPTPRLRLRRPRTLVRWVIAAIVVMFAAQFVVGTGVPTRALVRMGAMVPALVAAGQYWRLLTAAFLHVNILHLALNAVAISIFGTVVEDAFGAGRFAAIYLVTAFVANAASFAFGGLDRIAVGASGAAFGLLGAWLAYNWRRRTLGLARANVQGALLLVTFNLVLGAVIPGIDNLAHVGGLVSGIGAGFAAEGFGRGRARDLSPLAGLALVAGVGVALLAWGVSAFPRGSLP